MAAAERRALVRFALPLQPAGVGVEGVDHVADVAALGSQLDVARDHAFVDLGFGQALLQQLGDVVVAVDAG
jgi:hypothetical protein